MSNDEQDKKNSLKARVKNELRPFLRSAIQGLDQLIILDSAIPPEITEIYESAKATKKWRYRRVLKRYQKYALQIDKHNLGVKAIWDRLDEIDLKALYDNAGSVTDDEAKEYYDFTSLALNYYVAESNPYRKKIDALRFFGYRIKDIREQWGLWEPFKSIKDAIDASGYIKRQESLVYEEKEKLAREAVKDIKQAFYPFDTFPPTRELVLRHNQAVLDELGSDPLFDNIGGVSLDLQQRRAAVTPEPTSLVIAGAGSGKTTTICGRVNYLLQRQGVKPDEILLLSYSKKSADDLAAKMALIDPSLSVGTFHKIGLDILKCVEANKPTVEEQWDAIIEEYFRDELTKDPEMQRNVLTYYGLFLDGGESNKKYQSEGELFADLKTDDFITFKESLLRMSNDRLGLETIKKERVKSFEELAIANYYFINGVEYQYEKAYEYDESTPERRQYTPDFYLKEYGIYHEHFGVDAEGKAKQFDGPAGREYVLGVMWKHDCHQRHGTKLVETFSAYFSDGTVFERLEKKLKEMGVEFHPIGDDVVRDALESVYGGQSFKSFINLVKSFLSLYKARYEDASTFSMLREKEFATQYGKARASLFLTICEAVYGYYMNRIRSEGKIDFDDMILQSTKALPSLNGFRFKHIIVDEFQDISYSRMIFLKRLIEHGNSSLFAVGDDWQSIYRFSGCDVNILLNFEEYFGLAERYFIGNVHRNSQQLQDVMTKFIEANPEQICKEIKAEKRLDDPIRVIYYTDDCTFALDQALRWIEKKKKDANVLLLGRNNKDINPYLTHRFYFDRSKGQPISLDFPNLNISYSTVHGSKGLEEDFVILLSAKDSPNGFPNKTEDDPLLDLVMSRSSLFPYAEERRLWYVALTRTRSYVFILVPAKSPSSFIEEMEGDFLEVNPEERHSDESLILCPRCKAGHLVLRQKDGESFYGCSNYPYCTYSINDFRAVKRDKRCPVCGDFMVYKHGQWGAFFGCHNYPRCQHTEKYKPDD